MNKHCPAILIAIPALLIVIAFTEGPPAGYSGSPLDGQNCAACHGTLPAGNLPGWISSNIPTEGYTPGETYSVAVTAIGMVAVKMGFQLTSENQVEKTGTFIITDPERTQLKGLTTVTHTTAGTAVTQLPATWMTDWVAPSSGSGAITFYAAVNQSNNDNSTIGDLIYVSSLTVEEAFVGSIEYDKNNIGHLYPNPAREYINLVLPVHSEVAVFDAYGYEVLHLNADKDPLRVDVSSLKAGIYHAQINSNGVKTVKRFIKE
jgi:hypothetical protein